MSASSHPPPPGFDAAAILESVSGVAYAWDVSSDRLQWGRNAGAVLSIDADSIVTGRSFASLLDPASPANRFDAVMLAADADAGDGVPYQLEFALRPNPDTSLWLEDTGRWFAGADGRPSHAHGILRVVSARHDQEQRLTYLAQFDQLTGEMNRAQLTKGLQSAMEDAVKRQASCGFLLIAIDRLARINESYGFDAADEVISIVAKRLRTRLRAGDMLGRFSGNKFGVVLRNCSQDDMTIAAERLLAGVREEVVLTAAGPIAITVTIGGVTAPRHARELRETLERAQEALDAAKMKRTGSFVGYLPSVERAAMRRENMRAGDEIVAALNERRIVLAFEPVVDAVTREAAFYEALMRIRCEDGTLAHAGAIIPIAERLGLVRLIDHRMLEHALDELAAHPTVRLSLNISPTSSIDAGWWDSLRGRLRLHGDIAERLIVEITEMAEFHDIEEARRFVTRVKDLGCRIAIDDFGAGYTSFRNLRRLGVDIVKIDGAFVQHLMRSPDDQVFVRTMLDLAQTLGLQTVAEWVQNEPAAALLREWGCDYLQGALIGLGTPERPWLKTTRAAAAKSVVMPLRRAIG